MLLTTLKNFIFGNNKEEKNFCPITAKNIISERAERSEDIATEAKASKRSLILTLLKSDEEIKRESASIKDEADSFYRDAVEWSADVNNPDPHFFSLHCEFLRRHNELESILARY